MQMFEIRPVKICEFLVVDFAASAGFAVLVVGAKVSVPVAVWKPCWTTSLVVSVSLAEMTDDAVAFSHLVLLTFVGMCKCWRFLCIYRTLFFLRCI